MGNILEIEDSMLTKMKENDYLYNNTIYLDTEIDRGSQVKFIRQLTKLSEQELEKDENDRKPIKIKISSYGGSVLSVFAMISYMEYYKEKGIVIETYNDGFSMSGGSKILMCGTKGKRYSTRYGNVLIHQTQLGGMSGTQTEIKSELENIERNWDTIKEIFRKNTNLTEEDIEGFTKYNLDVTYTPQECLEKGIIDNII